MVMDLSEHLGAQMAVERRIQPTYGYYRQSNGWITVSPITRLERVRYIEEGWTHLQQYGAFDMSPYVAAHPFEALFMFGGVEEMPVEQVIQTGLYLDPPLLPRCRQHLTQFHRGHGPGCWMGATRVVFPQLAKADPSLIGPFLCDFCDRQMATIQAREQHQSVAHKELLNNLRAGRSLAEALRPNDGSTRTREELERENSQLKASQDQFRRELDELKELLKGQKPAGSGGPFSRRK